MASNPSTKITISELDQSSEVGKFSIHVDTPIDMDTLPLPFTDLIGAMDTELIDGINLAYVQNTTRRIQNAGQGTGNREDKLLMVYQDNVTLKIYTTELPCRKAGLAVAGANTDSLDPATYATTKTAWDAFVKSIDGNATTLLDVQIVGRNV